MFVIICIGIIFYLFCCIPTGDPLLKENFNIEKSIKLHSFFCGIITSLILILLYYFTDFFEGDSLYNFTSIVSDFCALFLIIALICIVVDSIKNKGHKKKKTYQNKTVIKDKVSLFHTIIMVCVIVSIFVHPVFRNRINYHHLNKEPTGTVYGYYVIAENENGKKYTLPAKVYIGSEDDEYEDMDGNTHSTSKREYYITNVFFSGNQFLYFEDRLQFSKINQTEIGYDQIGKKWKIQLTDKYANCEYITDKPIENISYIDIVSIILSTIYVIQFFVRKQYFTAYE